ncbi:MerR family transcriptional regulator [Streptomyces pinistramenti]|uniref:MerR family transcriptional regulator n=1 Tax=Streptomyces pinistramenti TaxID=2884812 RepID=UPI001D097F12|nr:MerR family transcriptional regulator [Streptomyces pinistramenti]MCB5912067.1 MerR family transcriptional regulator [Streptomyces pinistramenti]
MTDQPQPEYRIEDLAHLSGATVRTIRAYQDRGLLPRPERRGRANVYGDAHLARLRQISDLLERGYTLASIKELLEAWDAGRDLGGVLGLVAEIDGPWTDEKASRIGRADLHTAFGGVPDDAALSEAVELGVLERIPGQDDEFLVPSPQELAVAAELHSAGVPLAAIARHLREVRAEVEHIASRFLDFTTEHVFRPFLDHPPTEAEAVEAASLIRRLRPLAQQTIDAELARAMRTLATRHLRHHLVESLPPAAAYRPAAAAPSARHELPDGDQRARTTPSTGPRTSAPGTPAPRASDAHAADAHAADTCAAAPGVPAARDAAGRDPVALPAATVRAVRDLVGPENAAEFIAAAAQREVQARTMDALASPTARDGRTTAAARPTAATATTADLTGESG